MTTTTFQARRSQRPTRHRALPIAYLLAALLGATGGANPTGISWFDAAILATIGATTAALAVRARTVPLYATLGAAVLVQQAPAPRALGVIGLVVVVARTFSRRRSIASAIAGGLGWACIVGSPGEPLADHAAVPLAALCWMAVSAYHHGSRTFRRRTRRVTTVAVVVLGLTTLAGAAAVAAARTPLERGARLVEQGLDAARAGDTDEAVRHLEAARRVLSQADAGIGAPWVRPAWLVPGVGQNLRSLHDLTTAVDELAEVAVDTAREANVDDLAPSNGRIDLAAIAAIEVPLTEVIERLRTTSEELDEIGTRWLLPPVRDRLDDVTGELAEALPDAELALEGVRVAPAMFGGDGDATTYLVLFTTPVESRAVTGFPGNYAEITFVDGRFELTEFGRITDLNEALGATGSISGPEEYVARYGPFRPHREWRNITMSPDFPTVAAVAAELYPQSGGTEVDGVMSIDPYGIAALMQFTGPVQVPGIDQPVGPAEAVDFLLRGQYLLFPDRPDRTDALEVLAETTFDRLASADLPGPRQLGRVFGPVVAQGHLQVASFTDDAVHFLDGVGISGRFPTLEGDLLGVTTTNAAGNKIDLFAQRSISYQVDWDPTTGRIDATVTVTLANDAPNGGLPDDVIDNALGLRPGDADLPVGWNSSLVSVYTPLDLRGATLDGESVPLGRNLEVGVQALSTFVEVAPGEQRTLEIRLTGVVEGDTYVLDLLGQPMVNPDEATVDIRVAGGGRPTVTGPVATGGGGQAVGTFTLVEPTRITVRR